MIHRKRERVWETYLSLSTVKRMVRLAKAKAYELILRDLEHGDGAELAKATAQRRLRELRGVK